MTLQMLQYFIAAARCRSFTKAAKACFVTQPALSRAIQELENELGCHLLIRTSRNVFLTPEGEVCLAEAERLLKQCDHLKERVREASQNNQRPLRVGYLIYGHLTAFVKWLTALFPEGAPFALETEYDSPSRAKRKFMAGELDALLLPEACAQDLEGTESGRVIRSCAYGIFYKAHPLFHRDSVKLQELHGQKFIMWNSKELPFLCDQYTGMCLDAGFAPRIIATGEKMGDITAMVALHNGVGLAAEGTRYIQSEDFHCIKIEDSPCSFGLVCVWHKNDRSSQTAILRQIFSER